MKIPEMVKNGINNAAAKTLATAGNSSTPHAIPISTVLVKDEEIWLFNYFMGITVENIKENPKVSFVAWTGLEGVHVDAEVDYHEDGEIFEEGVTWIAENEPTRTLKGLLILKPTGFSGVRAGTPFAIED